jgi:hypothetical protein
MNRIIKKLITTGKFVWYLVFKEVTLYVLVCIVLGCIGILKDLDPKLHSFRKNC